MVAITTSTKNFSTLIDLQLQANKNLESIKKIMEFDRAIQLANLYETRQIDADGDRLEEVQKKALEKSEIRNKQQEELNDDIKKIKETLYEVRDRLVITQKTSPNDLSEKEMDQMKQDEKTNKLLEQIEENTRLRDDVKETKKESGFFGNLKSSISNMGGMAKNFLAIAGSLWILSKALQNFAKINWTDIGKASATMVGLGLAAKFAGSGDAYKSILALSAGTLGLSFALEKFENIKWESIGKATAVIMALGASIRLAGKGGVWKDMLAFSAGIIAMAYGLDKFSDVNWSDIGKASIMLAGLVATTKLMQGSILGVLSLLGMTAAVWGLSKALENFQNLEWETIGKGLLTLLGIGALGAAAGLAAPLLLAGAAAIGALGLALYAVGSGLEQMIEGFERLGAINGANLYEVAKGIGAVSAALLGFAAAEMITALSNLVTNFLSIGQDNPVEQLEKIGKAGNGIEKAANSMEKLAKAIKMFSGINVDNLDEIVKSTEKLAKFGAKIVVVEKTVASADSVYKQSSELANIPPSPLSTQPTTVIAAPSTNVKQTKNYMMNIPVRNQDVSINSFYKSRLMA